MIKVWLSMRHFTFFFTWGIFLPYWTVWLIEGKSFTVEQAGIIVGLGLVSRSLSNICFFPIMCRYISLYTLATLIPLISTIVAIFFITFDSFISIAIITIVFSLFYPTLLPLNETISTVISKEHGVSYGKSRSWGSIGYIVALLSVGVSTYVYNDNVIVYIMILGCMVIYLSSAYKTPTALKKRSFEEKQSVSSLIKAPNFMIVIIICLILQGSHAAYYSYGTIYLESLGINKVIISIILMIAVIAEIIFFAIADRFFSQKSFYFMFLIASCAAIIRWFLVYEFNNPIIFIISQVLHAFTFGLAHYAFIRYVNSQLSQNLVPLAQGIYSAFAMSLSTGLLTLFSSYLYNTQPNFPFLGMTIILIPCLLLSGLLYFQNSRKQTDKGVVNSEL